MLRKTCKGCGSKTDDFKEIKILFAQERSIILCCWCIQFRLEMDYKDVINPETKFIYKLERLTSEN